MFPRLPKIRHPSIRLSRILEHASNADIVVALLGASNLARARRAVVKQLRKGLRPCHVDFLSAVGPGRGYCVAGGIFNARYRPIGSCGILEAVREKASTGSHVVALVTDIGNDIMYGVPAEDLIGCLNRLFSQLRVLNADVMALTIPVDLENDVSEWRFRFLRGLFFPRSTVDYREAIAAVRKINRFLEEKQKQDVSFHTLKNMEDCVGWDKIHYSLHRSHLAWTRITAEMFRCLKRTPPGRIGRAPILNSFVLNVIRVLLFDIVRMRSTKQGMF